MKLKRFGWGLVALAALSTAAVGQARPPAQKTGPITIYGTGSTVPKEDQKAMDAIASTSWVRSYGSGYANVLSCLNPAQLADVYSGNAALDLTSTIQTCLTGLGAVKVIWPGGTKYQIAGTITPPNGQDQLGVGTGWNSGSTIIVPGSPSAPTFRLTGAQAVNGFAFISTTTAQEGHSFIDFEGNGGTAKENFFFGGFSQIYLGSASFYTQIDQNKFGGGAVYAIRGVSTADPGIDFTARGNRFLSAEAARTNSIVRLTGLGSMIWTDNQISVSGTNGPSFYIESVAPLYGGTQIINSVFEQNGAQPAFYAQGTVSLPVLYINSVNNFFTASQGPAVLLGITQKAKFSGGAISSLSTQGPFQVQGFGNSPDISISGVEFQGDAGVSPIQFRANSGGSITLSGVTWSGAAPLVDASAMAPGALYYLNAFGGQPGTSPTPYKLPASTPTTIAGKGALGVSGKIGAGTLTPGNPLTSAGPSLDFSAVNTGSAAAQFGTGTGIVTDTAVFAGAKDSTYGWVQAAKPGSGNLPLLLNPNGGTVALGKAGGALSDVAGLPLVPAYAGTPVGAAAGVAGFAPLAVDTTNSKICSFIGGLWKCATLQ